MPNDSTNAADQTLQCRDCQSPFTFTAGEQAFFAERQFTPPTRCKPCRQKRKAEKDARDGGGQPQVQAQPVAPAYDDRGGGGRKGGRGGGGGGRRRDWDE